jgi:RNA polymerase sigma factor (sigma-70 family)
MEFVKRIETLFRTGTSGGLTDRQLLEQFLERRGDDAQDAFAALVDRHGAMVLRVCRQILPTEEDAEDAAQAAFLVLARRAPSISRRESLACWLHGVARRAAANLRVAHSRRRKLEHREGELRAAAGHVVHGDFEAIENHDDWARLHDELGSLPQSFRDPIILCYLDGLTQEQAAAQLRCPLGTIQSRLARGRAKLKTQLEKRGVGLSSAFAAANQIGGLQSCPAPQGWAEATVRLAVEFGRVKAPAIASAAAVALAERVCRGIVLSKLKIGAAITLLAAVLLSGATALALRPHRSDAAPILTQPAAAAPRPPQDAPPKQAFPPFESATRTIRGIVRDEQGRPVPKAWIGLGVSPRPRRWQTVLPADRIRERKEPFRDGQGKIVPAGVLGKDYELRNADGKWQPIDPSDIRPCESFEIRAAQLRRPSPFDDDPAAAVQGTELFEICVEKDRLKMKPLRPASVADRTDVNGNFSIETNLPTYMDNKLYFAAPDFTQQASRVIRADRPYNSMQITLRPTRLVRGSVIASAQEVPFNEAVSWHLERDDPAADERDPRGEEAMSWQNGELQRRGETSTTLPSFPLELRVPEGHYKLRVESETQFQTLTLVVPPGPGPLELPDTKLKPFAWLSMLGKQAPEIEAVDLEGIPVTLADLRGKVVVIVFWSTNDRIDEDFATIRYLAEIQTRFKSQPLAILALHDASVESPDRLKQALEAMDNKAGERSIRILLDYPPIATKNGRDAGEVESGRTADIYENWANRTEFLIDKLGTLVSVTKANRYFVGKDRKLSTEVSYNSLVWALEDQFGLPRSPAEEPDLPGLVREPMFELTVIKGKVLDSDGKPIARATVTDGLLDSTEHPLVKSGPDGEFTIRAKKPSNYFHISVEAPGFAPRDFKMFVRDDDKPADFVYSTIDRSGVIRRLLQLGRGVELNGRLLKNGKPITGVAVGLKHANYKSDLTPLRRRETKTDANGQFQFSHIAAETDFWVYTKLESFADGSTLIPVRVRTTGDGSTLDTGELHVGPGRTLAGRLVFSDGKAVPDDLELIVGSANVAGDLKLHPGPDGRFKFTGLPAGSVSLFVNFRDHPFLGPGPYRFSEKNRCVNPEFPKEVEGRLDDDVTDLTLLLDPAAQTKLSPDESDELDPAVIADFNDAKAGPITGVPPRP